jgi:hypothetical protein
MGATRAPSWGGGAIFQVRAVIKLYYKVGFKLFTIIFTGRHKLFGICKICVNILIFSFNIYLYFNFVYFAPKSQGEAHAWFAHQPESMHPTYIMHGTERVNKTNSLLQCQPVFLPLTASSNSFRLLTA